MTARCAWCEQVTDREFCSPRCKLAWHNQRNRETGWLALMMLRQLWPYRPEGWQFIPVPFPTVRAWREEWNRAGEWLRGQIKERDDA